MKTLYHSLLDYDTAQLKAIAECRAVALTSPSKAEAVRSLTEALLSPAATAIILAHLTEGENKALRFLIERGGQIEAARFAREYGSIRLMGSARLEREQPWTNPANVAEGLWYRGLIFKAFQWTVQGNLEMVYIPSDLLALLHISFARPNDSSPAGSPEPHFLNPLSLVPMPEPPVVVHGHHRLRESIFCLLVYLQTTPVRFQNDAQLGAGDRQKLVQNLLPPLLPRLTSDRELDFTLHLARRAGLLVSRHGRLRPDRDPVRAWLQATPVQQIQLLQNTWRADPTWNDLWHVPGLVLQPTGWENSPMLGRSKILEFLSRVESPEGSWLSPDHFVALVKEIEPDFQRPDGNYEKWYIRDTRGDSLMGFANWDKVEGAFIHYLLGHALLLLDVICLGFAGPPSLEADVPISFQVTPLGAAFLSGRPDQLPPEKPALMLRIDNNFYAHVPERASLYDRFQLARFAELDHRDDSRVTYRITQDSVGRALRNGVTIDQITAFLARATQNQTPLKVVETLRTWGARQDSVRLERATLLSLKHESLMAELRQHPQLAALLGEVIGPRTLLIPATNVTEVRRLLRELGYLTEDDRPPTSG